MTLIIIDGKYKDKEKAFLRYKEKVILNKGYVVREEKKRRDKNGKIY